jgi:hypothetical protein
MDYFTTTMNPRLFLLAVAVIAAFGTTATVVGLDTIATPALAQNMTDMGGNMTGGNWTAGNMTGGTPTG